MTAAERAELTGVLRRLAGNGRAVLLVEHDMRLVAAVGPAAARAAGGQDGQQREHGRDCATPHVPSVLALPR